MAEELTVQDAISSIRSYYEKEIATLRARVAEARASERERAAKVADAYIAFCDRENAAASYKREAARLIASRIRALSPKGGT